MFLLFDYQDEFATLLAILPKGPLAIFGLLIEKTREYIGLSDLEKHTQGGDVLEAHIGDVLSSSVTILGDYAGIIVDLFSDGKVLPQLLEIYSHFIDVLFNRKKSIKVTTWLEMNKMLMPNGQLMVNCGAATKELSNTSEMMQPDISKRDDPRELNTTINALCKPFPEQKWQASWKKLPKRAGENYLALTGPLPDLDIWSSHLPDQLSTSVKEWRSCTPSPS